METLIFYNANATPFIRDFGLMGGLLATCGLMGVAQGIFLARLNVIHGAMMEIRQREAAKGN